MTSGIDLALALIEDDCGTAIAKGVARDLVVYHRRIGGQSQYSDMLEMTPSFGRIRDVLCYAREHLHEPLTIEDLADIACLSLRQFNRVFVSVIGITPAKAIERLRLEEAQPRVEYGRDPLEKIAHDVGFNSLEKMRRSFISVFGRSPQELRRTARSYRTNDS